VNELRRFVEGIPDFDTYTAQRQVDVIVYYLTEVRGGMGCTATDVIGAFRSLQMNPYARTSPYMSEEANLPRTGRYIHVDRGYRLERKAVREIGTLVSKEPRKVAVSDAIKSLAKRVTDAVERSFVDEALRCYSVEAYRASVVMTWSLTIYRLRSHLLNDAQKLVSFNKALSSNPVGKIRGVSTYDELCDIPDSRFVELLRAAGVVSGDVLKILKEKLGTRDSAAHPSVTTYGQHKATEFMSDLLSNVILKYPG
jgi:hypothetical protein